MICGSYLCVRRRRIDFSCAFRTDNFVRDGHRRAPAFTSHNAEARLDIDPAEAALFLFGISNADDHSVMFAILPAENISYREI